MTVRRPRGCLVPVLILLGLISLFYVSCVRWPSLRYNAEITVNIETPSGIRSGSGVIGTEWRDGRGGLSDAISSKSPLIETRPIGDAIAIELDDGTILVAMLGAIGPVKDVYVGYGTVTSRVLGLSPREPLSVTRDAIRRAGSTVLPVPEDMLPPLVATRDPSDPEALIGVGYQDLPAFLGAGYRLHSVTLQFTDRRVTRTIDQVLPWLQGKEPGWMRQTRFWPNGEFTLLSSRLRSK